VTVTRSFSVFTLALLTLLFAQRAGAADTEFKAWLGSAFTIPGEHSELWLAVVSDTRPDGIPLEPRAANLTFKFLGDPVYPRNTRERLYVYKYTVLSYVEGTHTIPPFEITLNGKTLRSQSLNLHVARLADSAWFDQTVLGKNSRFASTIAFPRRVSYVGETTPAEVKVYFPAKFRVDGASIAELERAGVVAPRFEGSELLYPRHVVFVTDVRLAGQDYHGVCYRSTVTAIHDGVVSLGPGHARLTLTALNPARGQFVPTKVPLDVPVLKREFTARALPQPAPPEFRNAVGRFSLTAIAETTGLREGDPITVRLLVSGRGNLDTLDAPKLASNQSEWKVYPHSRLERQGESRDVSGVATFSQIIRPNGSQRTIPSFRLVFFDPEEERFHTTTSLPIPFEVALAHRTAGTPTSILPDVSTPVEDMESILGLVNPTRSMGADSPSGLWRLWHLLPALIAILLLAQITRLRILPRWRRPSASQAVERALTSVEQAGPGSREFLRASGSFIEHWIPPEQRDDKIAAVLERRDLDCYRPGSKQEELVETERRGILSHLRERALASVSLVVFLAILMLGGRAQAATAAPDELYRQAEAAWSEGSYRAAINLYELAHESAPLPADVLYNVGNCYFQLEERGLAALYYHRALHLEPHHAEARQNLAFLKRKTGAITMERPPYQQHLGKMKRSLFSALTAAGIWITVLAVLGIFASVSRVLRPMVWTGLSVGPLIAVAGGVCLGLYPNDLEFAPIAERAIMVNKVAFEARTEATSSSAGVISVPPGSLCRPLARRGAWTYVELANEVRGWVPSQVVRQIVPSDDEKPKKVADLSA
jgi:hypothetical protein